MDYTLGAGCACCLCFGWCAELSWHHPSTVQGGGVLWRTQIKWVWTMWENGAGYVFSTCAHSMLAQMHLQTCRGAHDAHAHAQTRTHGCTTPARLKVHVGQHAQRHDPHLVSIIVLLAEIGPQCDDRPGKHHLGVYIYIYMGGGMRAFVSG